MTFFPLTILLVACSGPSAPDVDATEPVAATPEVDEAVVQQFGWISEIVLEPSTFVALTQGANREGWIAMHAHDYRRAADVFEDPNARARAELALSLVYDDLNRVNGLAHELLFSEWDQRSGLPKGNDAPLVAALASFCASGSTAVSWAQRIQEGPGIGVARAMMQNRSPFDVQAADAFGRRIAIHREAIGGNEAPLMAAALEPLVSRSEDEAFVRRFWDPCLFHTLSQLWMSRMVRTLRGSASASTEADSWRQVGDLAADDVGVAGRLFAPWATAEDLRTEAASAEGPGLLGARSPFLRAALGVGVDAMTSDNPQEARVLVRQLDKGLDRWREQLNELAEDDGRALLDDLRLIQRFRQEWLVTRARLALHNERPHHALTYVEMARDPSSKLGSANGPSLIAVTAEVLLRLGRTREALDALQLLADMHPEVHGLNEVVGDLAVLRGLDRQGDSKENQ